MAFDLLTTVEAGGCSAKISPEILEKMLAGFPVPVDPNILVDISTHDDAGVYRLTDEIALVLTTDFFPPVCSDAYEFGQIAAANSAMYMQWEESRYWRLTLLCSPLHGYPLKCMVRFSEEEMTKPAKRV